MELLQLRYFLDVARTEHMTESARRLHVAQPALSQAIHRLERELGATLFDHVGRGIALSAAGRALEERVTPLVEALDELPAELARIEGREERTVRVDIQSASGLVVDAIARYQAERPAARFAVTQLKSEGKPWDVRVRTCLAGGDVRGGQRRWVERIGIALPRRFAPPGAPIDLATLADEPFICLAPGRAFRALTDRLCAAAGFAPTVAFESDNPAVVKKMIGLGLGVGFWPERSWGSLDDGNAAFVPVADERFARAVVVDWPKGALRSEAATFRDFLCGEFDRVFLNGKNLPGRS